MNDTSFDIEQDEIFGLFVPNGAIKTTTPAMVSTMLKPTTGLATVNGMDIGKDEEGVMRSIGIVFQDDNPDEKLTAWEKMDFHGRLYRIPSEIRRKRNSEL